MLRQSFCFLPKIGKKRELNLWSSGIHDWNIFLEKSSIKGINQELKPNYDSLINLSKQRLLDNDSSFFSSLIPSNDHWRLYNEFKDQAVFLDIETDGYYGSITVVGLYDNNQSMTFVRGINLDKHLLEQQLAKYKLLVTFNGSSFDLPVIKRYFNLKSSLPHVDLRFVCQKAGFVGGLKSIEKQLNIRRADEVQSVSGSEAVMLWHQFRQTGKREYLDLLVKYNEEDVINLPIIANKIIPLLWNKVRNPVTQNINTPHTSIVSNA